MRTLILALLCGTSTLVSAAQNLECPPRVRLTDATIEGDFDRTAFKPDLGTTPLLLSHANLYDGPPEQGAALKPHSTRRAVGADVAIWQLDAPAAAEGYWMSCEYGNGVARLTSKVSTDIQRCKTTSKLVGASRTRQIKFVCDGGK